MGKQFASIHSQSILERLSADMVKSELYLSTDVVMFELCLSSDMVTYELQFLPSRTSLLSY